MNAVKLTPWRETTGSVAQNTSRVGDDDSKVEQPRVPAPSKAIADTINFRGADTGPVTNPVPTTPVKSSIPIVGNSKNISNLYSLQAHGLRPYV